MITIKPDDTLKQILAKFDSGKPFCIGKISTNILNAIIADKCKNSLDNNAFVQHYKRCYPQFIDMVAVNDGIYPKDTNYVLQFIYETFCEHLKDLDICAIWNKPIEIERDFMLSFNKEFMEIPLRYIEPYYFDKNNRWTKFLQGKKVLVVSSKCKSIEKQYKMKDNIWKDEYEGMLPDFELITLYFPDAYYTISENKRNVYPENAAILLQETKDKMNQIDYDVCIVGAGAFGLPLAIHAKRMGKVGIHLGGAHQILFGIIGKRWEDKFSKMSNQYWTRPSPEEIPEHASKVEGGCYW